MADINFTELSDLQLTDLIDCKTKQADAMMAACTGEGFETFSNLNDDVQHDYLWTLAEMVSAVRRANDEVGRRGRNPILAEQAAKPSI